jgi:hypothetical protein
VGHTSPKHDRLIEALRRLKGGADVAIEQAASDILCQMYILKVHQVEAARLAKSVGPAKELRDIERTARKAADGKLALDAWDAAWARVPEKTRSRVWRPKAPPVVSRKHDAAGRLVKFERAPLHDVRYFQAPGLDMLVPKPQDALDAIKAEQERIKQTASAERRKRKRDQAEHAAIKAIRSAYQKLTGKKGGRTTDANGKLTGRLVRLGREVDQIFGTQLFAEKDSRRLR